MAFRLVEESEIVVVEALEELLPLDALERVLAAEAGIIDAQDSGIVSPAAGLDAGRVSAALLHPAPDLVVVDRGFC